MHAIRNLRVTSFVVLLVLGLLGAGCSSSPKSDDSSNSDGTSVVANAPANDSTSGSDGAQKSKQATAVLPPTGDLANEPKLDEPEELTEQQAQEIEKSIRAYTPPKEKSLFVNEAHEYLYRSLLDSDARKMYDAIVSLFDDPTNTSHYVRAKFSKMNLDTFKQNCQEVFLAVLYDHPEFFWADLDEYAPFCWSYRKGSQTIDEADVRLSKPYSSYKSQMTEFNQAAKRFLSTIDLRQIDADIARAIHDKLIAMVTYDDALCNSDRDGLGHTAYGALVHNDEGLANYAVCDGYSNAYVYLLQQAGIEAGILVGSAGSPDDLGNHAWCIVKLDGQWYEVDTTWDDEDADSIEADYLANYPDDYECAAHLRASMEDYSYAQLVQHMYYNLTTDEMSYFDPGDAYVYYHDDDWWTNTASNPTVHLRAGEPGSNRSEPKAALISLVPKATGTYYAH